MTERPTAARFNFERDRKEARVGLADRGHDRAARRCCPTAYPWTRSSELKRLAIGPDRSKAGGDGRWLKPRARGVGGKAWGLADNGPGKRNGKSERWWSSKSCCLLPGSGKELAGGNDGRRERGIV